MSLRMPPLLEQYLSLPPEASLILLTNVLGASSNWLILRFLHSALLGGADSSGEDDEQPRVLLVSFLRDLAFWKENAKRLGLDLEKLALKKRFGFVDGLTGLFVPKQRNEALRVREKVLGSPEIQSVSRDVQQAIHDLKGASGTGKVLLVVDQLDLLLAAGGDQLNAVNISDMLMGWREDAHATVVSLSADYPLVSVGQTPLETDHAAFLLGLAHQADYTMGLRLLDSGTARDVSGVIRITVGDALGYGANSQQSVEEKELLYFVGGDGGVRVFERGQ